MIGPKHAGIFIREAQKNRVGRVGGRPHKAPPGPAYITLLEATCPQPTGEEYAGDEGVTSRPSFLRSARKRSRTSLGARKESSTSSPGPPPHIYQ